ncbi:MAG: hypothetical protein AAGD01_03720 [Acidobacteriota bacterium]
MIMPSRHAVIAAGIGFGVALILVLARDIAPDLAGMAGLASAGLAWSTGRSMERLQEIYRRHRRFRSPQRSPSNDERSPQ